jgi:hypothetical protein
MADTIEVDDLVKRLRESRAGWNNTKAAPTDLEVEAADRIEELEAKLTIAMVGLVQSQYELDQYSLHEYPSDHPVHERYRQRDYDANPARIAIAKIKGEQL